MGIMEKKKVCKHFKKLNAHTCECFVFQNASGFYTMQSPNTLENSEQVLMRQVVQTIGK